MRGYYYFFFFWGGGEPINKNFLKGGAHSDNRTHCAMLDLLQYLHHDKHVLIKILGIPVFLHRLCLKFLSFLFKTFFNDSANFWWKMSTFLKTMLITTFPKYRKGSLTLCQWHTLVITYFLCSSRWLSLQ